MAGHVAPELQSGYADGVLHEKGGVGHDEVIHDHDLAKVNTADIFHLSHLSEEELLVEKKLKRKIDSLIMPLVILVSRWKKSMCFPSVLLTDLGQVYLMNYIDRNNYAAARLQGLEKDLHLVVNQYQTGLSILFVGYVSLPYIIQHILSQLTILSRS